MNSTEGALKPTDFHIDTSAIPREVGDCIAAATLDLIHEILRQPGGREMLDARTAARAERRAAERS